MSVPKAIVTSLSDGFIENTIDYNCTIRNHEQ